MKGSMEGVLPMLALFILSIAMATQSLPIAEALGQIVGESTDDIERVVDTRAYGDFYFYNYIPLAAEYSLNDASQALGQTGGGSEWNNNWLVSYEDNILWLNENINDASSNRISETIDGSESRNCEIPDSEYSINIFPLTPPSDYSEVEAEDTPLSVGHDIDFGDPLDFEIPDPEPIEVRCQSSSGETFYIDDGLFYSTETNATNNRYPQLMAETLKAFLSIEEELDELSGEEYDATATSCSSRSSAEESAERSVRDELEDDVESRISSGMSSRPERDFIELLVEPSENYYVSDAGWDQLNSGLVERSGSTTSETAGTCGCCGDDCDEDDPPCRTRYRGEATAEPNSVKMDWAIQDSEQKVIIGDQYENLEFRVEPYTHEFN